MEPTAVTLAVLAGGEGRRLGCLKTRLELSGRGILLDLIDRLDWPGPTVLVGHPDHPNPAGAYRFDQVVFDVEAAQGPMAGVLSAIEVCKTDGICVVGVDMVHLRRIHLERLLRAAFQRTATVAMWTTCSAGRRRIQPLPCWISQAAFAGVREYYRVGGRSLRGLLGLPGSRELAAPLDWPVNVFDGINTLRELAAVKGRIGSG
ncbi:MAG: NTP transferase domain-containing protein [Phycisphaerae bacterium]|nr:NTP transferase domain-containing protein [Phycisphaerae bacterium]MDW8261645.1 NTP transferase domain-containing protein [Phycisphaerales bacterium]